MRQIMTTVTQHPVSTAARVMTRSMRTAALAQYGPQAKGVKR